NNDGNIYCFRDPEGYKPLCHGILSLENKKFYIVASESCALDALGANLIADVKPGEVLKINPISGVSSYQIKKSKNTIPCLFEYIYFARPDSIIDGLSVADVRYRLGRMLAKNDFFDSENTIVVPVPDSGRSAAMGYAWESQLPYQEGLIKNRYVWKLKVDDLREKLNVIKNVVRNKNVILIDDSILSGETIKEIISMLRGTGVKSVHVRVSAPPIINNCEKNDSFSNRNLLIACKMREKSENNYIEEIRKYIGADSLKFQTLQGLIHSLGVKKELICKNCFSFESEAKSSDKSKKMDFIPLKS
ncbi:MAG: amidophosphoribosyltransferase, partial [Promethearchaeota archaeon]